MSLQFFVRERDYIKIYSVDEKATKMGPLDAQIALPFPEVATWSPNGRFLALVDPNRGVMIIVLSDEAGDISVRPLQGSSAQTRQLHWSSCSTFLLSLHPLTEGESNLIAWDAATGLPVTRFTFTRWREKSLWPAMKWSGDEQIAVRMDGNSVVIMDGQKLTPLHSIQTQSIPTFEIGPTDDTGSYRVAVFCPELRSSDLEMKVLAPGKHEMVHWNAKDQSMVQGLSMEMVNAESAEIMWSANGKSYIVHTHQDVDTTGQSYFGASNVYILAADGSYHTELSEVQDDHATTSAADKTIQAVVWSPAREEFVLIQGFQPATASLWSVENNTCRRVWTFPERMHRNTVRWNRFGSLLCLGGFGNLAGDMDFWYREAQWTPGSPEPAFVRCGSAKAACTVACEWAPNGRHFITAVLAPRMRVDNAVTIWRGTCGQAVNNQRFQELFEAVWKPSSYAVEDLSEEETRSAKSSATAGGAGAAPKKQAYRPPGMRGENAESSSVAARMQSNEDISQMITSGRRPLPQQRTAKGKGRGKENGKDPLGAVVEENGVEHEKGRESEERETGWGGRAWALRGREEVRDSRESEQDGKGPFGSKLDPSKGKGKDGKGKRENSADDRKGKGESADVKGKGRNSPEPGKGGWSPEPGRDHRDGGLSRALDSLQVHQDGAPKGQAPAPAPERPDPRPEPAAPPESGWEYVDTGGKVQGPFSLKEMKQWNQYGYFRPELLMRSNREDSFQPLREMYPDPGSAFATAPRKPRFAPVKA